jgi:predicted transcriptional regulator
LGNNNNKVTLSKWEIHILKSIKSKTKTEKQISKQVGLNILVVSQLITDLMLKGYVERTRNRRMLFSSKECFSATIEGLAALEKAGVDNSPWNQIMFTLKESGERTVLGLSNELPIKLTLGAIKTTYRLAKFILK